MMVKENDRWLAINSRDEAKIRAYHHQLETQRTASTLNVRVQATTLEGNWLRAAEFSAGMLEQAKVSDPHQMMTAVETHIRVKQEAERVPPTAEACDLFIAKQEKRNLSSCTIRDYKRLARDLKATFADRNLSTITSTEITAFIEQKKNPVSQRARFIYLKSFLCFCAGKRNPHCNGTPWVKEGLIQWEPANTDLHEIKVYNYEEIISLLKVAQTKGVLPYFIFRLFGMLRSEEMLRFIEIHPRVKDHPLISLEAQRVTFSPQVYKKRSRNEHRGRFYNNIHPTFAAWLKTFHDEDASLDITEDRERDVRTSIAGKESFRNLLRHSAITYHCLAFKNPLQTAYIAGNSVGIIQNHYLNMNVPEADALKLYELTPERAKELGILS